MNTFEKLLNGSSVSRYVKFIPECEVYKLYTPHLIINEWNQIVDSIRNTLPDTIAQFVSGIFTEEVALFLSEYEKIPEKYRSEIDQAKSIDFGFHPHEYVQFCVHWMGVSRLICEWDNYMEVRKGK